MGDITADALKLLRKSSHLRTVAWILALTITASTLIDWELNKAVELFVTGEDEMTAFWGQFFAIQNVASVAIQVLFTSWVLQTFGVGAGLLALPLGLLVASVGVVAVPALLTAALAKGTEGALRYSLDQSTRELLYMPVPAQVKYKVKPLIDLAVYRGGTGLAGLILLISTTFLGFSIREVGVLCVLVIGGWLTVAVKMRSEFRDSIKRLIGTQDVELDELIVRRLDALTVEELRHALQGDDERRILYALSLLEHAPTRSITPELRHLIRHDSARVRARALGLLCEVGTGEMTEDVRALLEDSSLAVRAEAVRYLVEFDDRHPELRLPGLQEASSTNLGMAVLAFLLQYGSEERRREALEIVRAMATNENPEERQMAARLLAQVPGGAERSRHVLADLFEDESPQVRRRAFLTAGFLGYETAIPVLLDRLRHPEDRRAAMAALREFGPAIEAQLFYHLADDRFPGSIRRRIPSLLRSHARQETVDRLAEILRTLESRQIRYEILKVLNKLRRNRPDLDFERFEVEPLLERESREAHRWFVLQHRIESLTSLQAPDSPDSRLLQHLLRQRFREAVERILRTLALTYSLNDLFVAYTALVAPGDARHEQGYELLESILSLRHRRLVDPLLDPDQPVKRKLEAAALRYGIDWSKDHDVIRELRAETDPWVVALVRRWTDRAEALPRAEDEDSFPGRAIARRIYGPETQIEPGDAMKLLDKAEFLQNTELLSALRTEDLAALAALCEERSYASGETIFEESTPDPGLYIVIDGEVVARRGEREAERYGPGDVVGDIEALGGIPARFRALAGAETRALHLPRQDLLVAMEERFAFARAVLQHLARRYEQLEETLERRPHQEA